MKHLLLLTALLALLVWNGCRPCDDPTNPECENYDPCHAAQSPYNLDFKMYQPLLLDHPAPVFDTVYMNRSLVLEADSGLDSYQWTIGLDTTKRRERRTTVNFFYPYGRILITLVGRWTPDTLCFPQDDGVDTVQKVIYVAAQEDMPLWGSFQGYATSAPEDTFTMRLGWEEFRSISGETSVMYGLPTDGCEAYGFSFGASAFYIGTASGRIEDCVPHGRSVYGHLDPSYDTLTVTYETYDVSPGAPSPPPILPDTFKAVRIR